jgi:predicted  nucleic acid-binding Zn-ribbon protein
LKTVEKSQLERLVLFQDINLMLQEAESEEKGMGFPTDGLEKLKLAKDDLAKTIQMRFLRVYERLSTRYKRPIVPVQNETCLGCFAKLPTSFMGKWRDNTDINTCEHCGRILFWIE